MDIVEFAEKVLGLELLSSQKILLKEFYEKYEKNGNKFSLEKTPRGITKSGTITGLMTTVIFYDDWITDKKVR